MTGSFGAKEAKSGEMERNRKRRKKVEEERQEKHGDAELCTGGDSCTKGRVSLCVRACVSHLARGFLVEYERVPGTKPLTLGFNARNGHGQQLSISHARRLHSIVVVPSLRMASSKLDRPLVLQSS